MSKVGLFLQRWSRLKSQPLAEPVPTEPVSSTPATPGADERLALPAVDELTLESDFSAFLQPEVDAETRRAAMTKLFMNDHYRTMDMLDVYVDDYSKPELLPAAMVQKLEHAVGLLAKPDPAEQSCQAALQPASAVQAKAAAGERIDDAGSEENHAEKDGDNHDSAHAGSVDEAGESPSPSVKPEPPAAG